MNCKFCKTQIADDSTFCHACGKKVDKISACSKCGFKPTSDTFAFCPKCGNNLKADTKPTTNNSKNTNGFSTKVKNTATTVVAFEKKTNVIKNSILLVLCIAMFICSFFGMFRIGIELPYSNADGTVPIEQTTIQYIEAAFSSLSDREFNEKIGEAHEILNEDNKYVRIVAKAQNDFASLTQEEVTYLYNKLSTVNHTLGISLESIRESNPINTALNISTAIIIILLMISTLALAVVLIVFIVKRKKLKFDFLTGLIPFVTSLMLIVLMGQIISPKIALAFGLTVVGYNSVGSGIMAIFIISIVVLAVNISHTFVVSSNKKALLLPALKTGILIITSVIIASISFTSVANLSIQNTTDEISNNKNVTVEIILDGDNIITLTDVQLKKDWHEENRTLYSMLTDENIKKAYDSISDQMPNLTKKQIAKQLQKNSTIFLISDNMVDKFGASVTMINFIPLLQVAILILSLSIITLLLIQLLTGKFKKMKSITILSSILIALAVISIAFITTYLICFNISSNNLDILLSMTIGAGTICTAIFGVASLLVNCIFKPQNATAFFEEQTN